MTAASVPFRTVERLSSGGGPRGTWRLGDWITSIADGRRASVLAGFVRAAAGLPRDTIPMFWFNSTPNFGDSLARVVVQWVSSGTPILVSGRCRRKLLAVGSVLHHLAEGDIVWGAGAIRNRPIVPPADVRFLAVRGPLTRDQIQGDVPDIFGDPAILLPMLYSPVVGKRFRLGVVPHYIDRGLVQVSDPAIRLIDVQAEWRTVVDGIVSCEGILSSSLHGLIVAEAYGIPAVWMVASDRVIGDGFKFRDYYLSTAREPSEPLRWPRALAEAESHLVEPPRLDAGPLLRSWPADLRFAAAEPRRNSGSAGPADASL